MDVFLEELGKYRRALEEKDAACLTQLLDEGRRRKREVDGP